MLVEKCIATLILSSCTSNLGYSPIMYILYQWKGHSVVKILQKRFEPSHDGTNNVACMPSQDSDQPGHSPGLISLRCPHEERSGP